MCKVGFIGLGIMGMPMSFNVLRNGYELVVYNRTSSKTLPLVENGAQAVKSPFEVAQNSDVIVMMLTGPEAIDQVVFGANGLFSGLNEKKYLINMSSVSPDYTKEIAKKIEPSGVKFIDAPVSGSKKPAEDGQLVILAGGKEEDVRDVEDVLLAMGKKVVYCGPVGHGSMMKMTINLLLGVMMAGMAEMMHFGQKGGLRKETMLEVLYSGALNCPLFQLKNDLFLEEKFTPQFPLKHMSKDLRFVMQTAQSTGAMIPEATTALRFFEIAEKNGLGEEDFAAVYKVFQQMVS